MTIVMRTGRQRFGDLFLVNSPSLDIRHVSSEELGALNITEANRLKS